MADMTRMSIGGFSEATGLSVKALRLYDSMGLVPPAVVDESNNYRWYDDDQVAGARLVARLRLVGMPLAGIRDVLALPASLRATWLRSWWRQVEADHLSRREQLAVLINQTHDQEDVMDVARETAFTVSARSGRGERDLALDLAHAGSRLFAVADGFGSDPTFPERLSGALAPEPVGAVDPLAFLDTLVIGLRDLAEAENGTTLTALLLGDGRAAVAHIGDTRLHLVRDGRVERLTRDHTFVQALVDEGRLTPEEARLEEHRALLNRAISAQGPAEPDLSVVTTRPLDRFVLTSDGVHAVVPTAELADLLSEPGAPDAVAASVEQAVIDAGAPDNYAVLVVELG